MKIDLILAPVLSYYYGVLTSNSSAFNRYNSPSVGQYYYDKIGISVSKDGLYEFASESRIGIVGYLYQSHFNYTNASLNLLVYSGNGISNQFYFRYSLRSDRSYILIATTYSSNVTGSFIIKTRGVSSVTFN